MRVAINRNMLRKEIGNRLLDKLMNVGSPKETIKFLLNNPDDQVD